MIRNLNNYQFIFKINCVCGFTAWICIRRERWWRRVRGRVVTARLRRTYASGARRLYSHSTCLEWESSKSECRLSPSLSWSVTHCTSVYCSCIACRAFVSTNLLRTLLINVKLVSSVLFTGNSNRCAFLTILNGITFGIFKLIVVKKNIQNNCNIW